MPSRVIFLLYRAALVLAFPFILAYVAYRCVKNRAYSQTLGERLGFLPRAFAQPAAGAIWLHAISVGEVISAVALVEKLRASIPGSKVFVSVGTLAGREIADKRLAGIADGVFWAPFDFVWAVRRVLGRLRPALVIVMETEIWPNLWRESKRAGAGLLVLNGRISDQTISKYESWRWFFAPVLQLADRILTQSEVSAERFVALGAPAERVAIGGNLKYDFDAARIATPAAVAVFVEAAQPGLVWVAASTMPPVFDGDVDEDEAVLDAYQRLIRDFPALTLILVPRRPERFATAAASLTRRGIAFVRRSSLAGGETARVLLLDSMGELVGVFRLADIVFMGGTLSRRGGHNILEPAFFGKAIVLGPHMENFPEIAADFRAANACRETTDLEAALRELIASDSLRAELGARAQVQAVTKTGATARAVEAARELYELSLPRPLRSAPARWALAPLAALWRAGGAWKRRRDLHAQRSLPCPVIAVGGIGAGGVGKTPFVLHLAELLSNPAFLTRGYRRISRDACTVIPAGGPAPIEQTGDEAQLLVRSGLGPVGIAASRFTAGQRLLAEHSPGVLLLDDGFQHARLARDLDIVVIDTLDPFAGFDLIPAGRLREPLAALGRAGAFVLMRCEPGRTYAGIVRVLRQYNATAPVFRARLEPHGAVDPSVACAAFCGLGNPASFWRTLEQLGMHPVSRTAFPDHHRYHPRDLRRLAEDARAAGAKVLVTTEKDWMNLPPGPAPLEIQAIRVRARLENQAAFLAWLKQDRAGLSLGILK